MFFKQYFKKFNMKSQQSVKKFFLSQLVKKTSTDNLKKEIIKNSNFCFKK